MLDDPEGAAAAIGGAESGCGGVIDERAGPADEVYFEEPVGGGVGDDVGEVGC